MGRIQKILVPVDGSVNGCKAVDEAIFFAEKCKADLDFVYVASNINKDIPSHIVFDRIWEKLPDDIKASKHVETGNIPKAIMRVAALARGCTTGGGGCESITHCGRGAGSRGPCPRETRVRRVSVQSIPENCHTSAIKRTLTPSPLPLSGCTLKTYEGRQPQLCRV